MLASDFLNRAAAHCGAPHSCRRATNGSNVVAYRAGIQHAAEAIAMYIPGTTTKVIGSSVAISRQRRRSCWSMTLSLRHCFLASKSLDERWRSRLDQTATCRGDRHGPLWVSSDTWSIGRFVSRPGMGTLPGTHGRRGADFREDARIQARFRCAGWPRGRKYSGLENHRQKVA